MSQSSREVWLSRVQMLFTHTEWGNSQSQKKMDAGFFQWKYIKLLEFTPPPPNR